MFRHSRFNFCQIPCNDLNSKLTVSSYPWSLWIHHKSFACLHHLQVKWLSISVGISDVLYTWHVGCYILLPHRIISYITYKLVLGVCHLTTYDIIHHICVGIWCSFRDVIISHFHLFLTETTGLTLLHFDLPSWELVISYLWMKW